MRVMRLFVSAAATTALLTAPAAAAAASSAADRPCGSTAADYHGVFRSDDALRGSGINFRAPNAYSFATGFAGSEGGTYKALKARSGKYVVRMTNEDGDTRTLDNVGCVDGKVHSLVLTVKDKKVKYTRTAQT